MVCLLNEGISAELVRLETHSSVGSISLYPGKTGNSVFQEVARQLQCDDESLKLSIKNTSDENEVILLNDFKNQDLKHIGLNFSLTAGSYVIIVEDLKNDDNPQVFRIHAKHKTKTMRMAIMPPPVATGFSSPSSSEWSSNNYVGLVNQAMTCYLNSLLQALYMTPEFRNALYNWEFDGNNAATSIPFQLQRLFLNLQTSAKSAVETTDLTQSFGWNVQQAWEQHDIQELCRVMFDALEQKFKDTKQANLLNDLYEGKMLDYVTCLECKIEKSREDTFQDIPLPVRPFGSSVAYNSVEEALCAFVQPETLDGNNQYFCEKCNKKCDAHKGLKFIKFPYLLTLHLKRFDFDYNTGNRIKLNDKVVFPEILNLNSFMANGNTATVVTEEALSEAEGVHMKNDDCSTTDSGSALDDEGCQGPDISSTINSQDDSCQDDDEGIDVSLGINHQENEKNRLHEIQGPYVYELFSILIHSGSASGGHYYAYIKDFSKNHWFCFNDQSVTSVTNEDIHKTYGGGPQRGYYTGAYTSSTNAYMLMYRQIDKERNCEAYTVEEFPPHIQTLLQDMRENEESQRKKKEEENDSVPIKLHCYHPEKQVLMEKKMLVFGDTYLSEATEDARERFKLTDVAKPEDCRLVAYSNGLIECSFESNILMNEITRNYTEFLFEVKLPGTEFDIYKTGGVMMKTYIMNLETEEVDGPGMVWINAGDTVRDLQRIFAIRYNMETVHIAQETFSNQPRYLDDPNSPVRFAQVCNGYRLYISNALNIDGSDTTFWTSSFLSFINRCVHVIMLKITIPETDATTLDILSIPPLDPNQCLDRIELAASSDRDITNPSSLRVSPLPGPNSEGFGDQSNSEDSSLSDSDRTLVGDAPGDNIGLLSSSSNSPADQHMSSPTDGQEEDNYPIVVSTQEDVIWWENMESTSPEWGDRPNINYYFRAQLLPIKMLEGGGMCKVLLDKRMTLGMLKKNLEPIVGVSMEYFKIYRSHPTQDCEWSSLKDNFSAMRDDDRLIVKLGRVLKENEFAVKVFRLQLSGPDTSDLLFDCVAAKDQLVSVLKKEILIRAKKQHMIDIPFNKCRLRKREHKIPTSILMDDEKLVDPISEVFLQEIDGPERTSSQVFVFIRQWCPSTLTVAPFQEITLESKTKTELKSNISAVSNIPVEFLEVAYVQNLFPCDLCVLDIPSKFDWNFEEEDLRGYPMSVSTDGSVFYYKDTREAFKELTGEERAQLYQSECQRLGKFVPKLKPRRREHGLKIYVDTSPKKEDEVFLD